MLSMLLLATLVRGPADVESLTAASDTVVRAQVVRRTSAWGKSGGQIFTTVVLRPIETWKGDPAETLSAVARLGAGWFLEHLAGGSTLR